jgi:predicted enzyme related to lactoylglutathione lyase
LNHTCRRNEPWLPVMTTTDVELFLVELTVTDWPAALAWYRDRFGLTVSLVDAPNRYALLTGDGGRVALKAGSPMPGTTRLTFRVANLDTTLAMWSARGLTPAGPVQTSLEGYRRTWLLDPDGHRLDVFEWVDRSETKEE